MKGLALATSFVVAVSLQAQEAAATSFDTLPRCTSDHYSDPEIRGHDRLVLVGDRARISVARIKDVAAYGYRLAAVENGRVIFDETSRTPGVAFDYHARSRGELRVTLTYVKTETEWQSENYEEPCASEKTVTRRIVPPRRFPAPVISVDKDTVWFRLKRVGQCSRLYRPRAIRLVVRDQSSKMVSNASAPNPCRGFDRWSMLYVPHWRTLGFTYRSSYALRLWFPWFEKRSGTRRFTYVIRQSGRKRPLRRGVIVTRAVYHRADRVYAWHGASINDDYWNFCVNEGRPTFMDGGNAYCNTVGYYDRSVRILPGAKR